MARASKRRINPNPPLDRDRLHLYLWERSNEKNHITIVNVKLAEDLDVSHYTIGRIVKEFCQQRRLFKIAKGDHNVGTYKVYDPVEWKRTKGAPQESERREVKWG